METEREPGYLGMSKTWFYRALIAGMIVGPIFAGAAQQWWVTTITITVAVAVGSVWSGLWRRHERRTAKGPLE